ncbi:MAG: histidine kinase [Tannerellaceae bacterium]|nr:histidine kinase [Tannerellaceae bacterium]
MGCRFLFASRYRWCRYLVLQLVLVLITMNIFWDTPDEVLFTPERITAWLCYFTVVNIIVYLNSYVLIPRFLLTGKLFSYLLWVLLAIFLALASVIGLESLAEDTVGPIYPTSMVAVLLNVVSSVLSIGLILAGTTSFILYRHWMEYTLRVQELRSATLASELELLKNQINPHFLFNMLNNSILLIKKKRKEAANVLFKLEDLLRYQLKDSTEEQVLLSSDIRFLDDFLNLEKLRRDDFIYTIAREGALNEVVLPPLLFIPFVENAVKHSQDSEQGSFVHLSFVWYGNKLSFTCENSVLQEQTPSGHPGGLGLKNIRRRLELLFPEKYRLAITQSDTTYKVNLELNL